MTETKPAHPTMVPVKSSQISHVGHDPENKHLFIQFWRKPTPEEQEAFIAKGETPDHAMLADGVPTKLSKVPGSIYRYDGATTDHHTALVGAESIGSHFGKHIKGNPNHPFTKVS